MINFINNIFSLSHTCTAPSEVRSLTANYDISVPSSYDQISGFYEGTLEISWTEPEFPNGVITEYTYTVEGPSPSSAVVYTGNTTITSVQIDAQLIPVGIYVVMVTAATIGGPGMPSDFIISVPEASK